MLVHHRLFACLDFWRLTSAVQLLFGFTCGLCQIDHRLRDVHPDLHTRVGLYS